MSDISIRSNNLENLRVGELRAKWNASGTYILRYYLDVAHVVMDLHKELSAPELDILQNKADVLVSAWDKKYETYLKRQAVSDGKMLAADLTTEAEIARDELRCILSATLDVDDSVDWDVLKSKDSFSPKLFEKARPLQPPPIQLPQKPKIGLIDRLIGRARRKAEQHSAAVRQAEQQQIAHDQRHLAEVEKWRKEIDQWDEEQNKLKKIFERKQRKANDEVDRLKSAWLNGEPEAIVEHSSIVLENSKYPDIFQKNFDLQYSEDDKTLLVEYQLPDPKNIPNVKVIRFVSSTGELKETHISQKESRELYDSVCYQICLRTIHEVLEADSPHHISHVVFNGIIDTVDQSTGNDIVATIMSLIVEKDEFVALNLDRLDPKACFKSLKGVSAASLAGLAAVAPVMEMDKSDRRFVEARSVDLGEDGSTNLVSMDWEEFEHLVRQLFEKEFASRGGEVKVTRSSSDGGVDAVAFDPDPISGGKIVIQAKRYTNTVGVSAVRDLYGTTLSEGASKGILVTTSDYGSDAYKFASGKPISLLTGAHLLHLLEKHGVNAKIDIAAARKDMGLA